YPDVNPPSPEISNEEIFQAKGDLMKSIQTFLKKFNYIPFEEKPQILFQTWETFFAIQCSQPEDSNELFHKLLRDLKELAEYDHSTNTDRPIFLNDNHLENSSKENVVSKTNQEPPQDSDIHQLIEECSVEVLKEQKQKMKDTMFNLVKICHHKQFLCIHDDINNLIESALDSKLLSINSINSQRLDKKEQEVKNVEEQSAGRRNLAENITPETESDEVIESNAENLLPIPSKCEVTLEDKIEYDMLAKDVCSPVFTLFSNPLFKDNDNFDSSDDESLPDEDDPAEEFKFIRILFSMKMKSILIKIPKYDFDFEEEIRLIENFMYDNSSPRPPEELNAEIADTIIESIPLLPIPVQDGEADLFLSDNSIPPGIENVADDPEGDVRFIEELLIDDSILSHESFDFNFENNPIIP
nr:hypothetical protein [Tanacetum cinerariifolium]